MKTLEISSLSKINSLSYFFILDYSQGEFHISIYAEYCLTLVVWAGVVKRRNVFISSLKGSESNIYGLLELAEETYSALSANDPIFLIRESFHTKNPDCC